MEESKNRDENSLAVIGSVAIQAYKSRKISNMITNAHVAQALMYKAYELGLPLMSAFDLFHYIKGKLTISPKGALTLILKSGQLEEMSIKKLENRGVFVGYEVSMTRKDPHMAWSATFTMRDAERANLIKENSGWVTYPENMCRWRAIGFVSDILFPDIIHGMKRSDEMGLPVTETGEVIVIDGETVDGEYDEVFNLEKALDALFKQHNIDHVLKVSGGVIPTNQKQFEALVAKMEESEDSFDEEE